jgi:hypothetical protein
MQNLYLQMLKSRILSGTTFSYLMVGSIITMIQLWRMDDPSRFNSALVSGCLAAGMLAITLSVPDRRWEKP